MKYIAVSALISLSALSAEAADFSFTGSFTGDADVAQFDFVVGALSTVTLRSYSYAGGTMADGTVITAGGFDPILALWDGSGNLIEEYDDGPESVPSDPVTGASFDTHLIISGLTAGNYSATITQFDNFAAGTTLTDGFTQSDAFFTASNGCSNGQFCDVASDNRTSFWAFDVLGVEDAGGPGSVPLPASMPLVLAGLGALGLLSRRGK